MRATLAERFWAKVRKAGPYACWEWTASLNAGGYGQIGRGGRHEPKLQSHRVSWELHFGPVPEDKWVLHSCDNKRCVNPAHLRLGVRQENMDDATERRRIRRGASAGPAKLSDQAVRTIRKLDRISAKALGEFFGVATSVASCARRGDTWRHIPMPERKAS